MRCTQRDPNASLGWPASDEYADEGDGCGEEVSAETGDMPENSNVQEKTGSRFAPWQCLCPRGDWQANRERARATDSPIWIQCSADAAMTLLRYSYELSAGFECSCKFVGFQSLFGGKRLTEEDCLSDALIVFHWESQAFQNTYTSKVLYEELARAYDNHCAPGTPCC